MLAQRHVDSFSLCQEFKHLVTKMLNTNTTAILVLVMVFCSLVQSSSELHAKTDVTKKMADLNVFLFQKTHSSFFVIFAKWRIEESVNLVSRAFAMFVENMHCQHIDKILHTT